MKTGLRPIIAAYLAACLVLAGVVGLSPSLHVLLEHGGGGAAHVHGRKPQTRPISSFAQPNVRSSGPVTHPHSHAYVSVGAGKATLFTHSSAAFPSVDELVARFWYRLHHWLEHEPPAPASRDAAPEHHHDSLASLLAEGGIEQADVSVQCIEAGCFFSRCLLTAPKRLCAFDRDPQSSPRAPPVSQG